MGNDWDAKFEFMSYFSRKLNSAVQELYHSQGGRICFHPGDILYIFDNAKQENNFFFVLGAFIGWSRELSDLSLDIKGNLDRGVIHVAHFQRKGKGRKTVITFIELPIEEYSKYGKENNE